jgi:ATP-dependent Lon protease
VKEALDIIPVSHVDEVLSRALAEAIQPIEWTEADEHAAEPPVGAHGTDAETAVRH